MKKSVTLVKFTSRGQVTIFIIVGLLVLMIFLFLMQISSNVKKSQLEGEKEKVFGSTFKKEALRIYVEDCLQDELTKGLILLGKQGRIWSDQPGGRKVFVEGLSGVISLSGDRVAYAITNRTYLQYPEAYPCDTEDNPHSFCRYNYPNVSFPFGELRMKESTLKEDLSNYLINRTVWCVQNFTASNISSKAEIETTTMDMNLDLQEDGIAVKVNYPITFKVGGESFSHISTFDFFYPTKFKQLLDAAVSFPLRHDVTYVDFKYDTATLSSSFFSYLNREDVGGCSVDSSGLYSCHQGLFGEKFTSLGITLLQSSLVNGDDLFSLTPALYTIVNTPDTYSFNFARQNRPPALDYISRDACDSAGYDYLVVEGADGDLGKINFKASAIDPDEDAVSYGIYFNPNPLGGAVLVNELKDNIFQVSKPIQGWYNVTAIVTDGHLEDKQKVRILVDRQVSTSVALEFPLSYGVKSSVGSDTYLVSQEDPIFMKLTIPSKSLTSGLEETKLLYNDGIDSKDVGFQLPTSSQPPLPLSDLCYNFPLGNGVCDIASYNDQHLKNIKEGIGFTFNPFKEVTEKGKLILDYNINYCGKLNQLKKIEKNIVVKGCVPVQNPAHPYAYPYNKFTFEVDKNAKTDLSKLKPDEVINPFESTHSCCLGSFDNPASWKIADEGTECFVNPKVDCYGGIKDYTSISSLKGYILEEQYATCDGVRGNMCNGGKDYRLPKKVLQCGYYDKDHPNCKGVALECQGQKPWSVVVDKDGKPGVCHGIMGCSLYTQDALIAKTGAPLSSSNFYDLSTKAKEKVLTDTANAFTKDADALIAVGCAGNTGLKCDANLDFKFNGQCRDDKCCNTKFNEPGAVTC